MNRLDNAMRISCLPGFLVSALFAALVSGASAQTGRVSCESRSERLAEVTYEEALDCLFGRDGISRPLLSVRYIQSFHPESEILIFRKRDGFVMRQVSATRQVSHLFEARLNPITTRVAKSIPVKLVESVRVVTRQAILDDKEVQALTDSFIDALAAYAAPLRYRGPENKAASTTLLSIDGSRILIALTRIQDRVAIEFAGPELSAGQQGPFKHPAEGWAVLLWSKAARLKAPTE